MTMSEVGWLTLVVVCAGVGALVGATGLGAGSADRDGVVGQMGAVSATLTAVPVSEAFSSTNDVPWECSWLTTSMVFIRNSFIHEIIVFTIHFRGC
jgi:hypothetical protein